MDRTDRQSNAGVPSAGGQVHDHIGMRHLGGMRHRGLGLYRRDATPSQGTQDAYRKAGMH
jgi:hypothetical protein